MYKEAKAIEAVGRELQQLAKEVRALDGAPAPKVSRKVRVMRQGARTNAHSALPWVLGFAVGGFVLYYYFFRLKEKDKKTDTPTAPTAPTTPGAPSLPAAPPALPTVLAQGSQGEAVEVLQRLLITAGYGKYLAPFGADGQWGNRTTDALTALTTDYNASVWDRVMRYFGGTPANKGTRVTRLTPGIALAVLTRALPSTPVESLSNYAQQLSAGTIRVPTFSSLFRA